MKSNIERRKGRMKIKISTDTGVSKAKKQRQQQKADISREKYSPNLAKSQAQTFMLLDRINAEKIPEIAKNNTNDIKNNFMTKVKAGENAQALQRMQSERIENALLELMKMKENGSSLPNNLNNYFSTWITNASKNRIIPRESEKHLKLILKNITK